MPKLPAHKFRIGAITATIWDNDGFYTVDMSRSYKDSAGQWQTTSSFAQADLLNLSKLAQRAESWIAGQSNAA
ncbi:hypothetical protein EU803_11285 [Loktanella sp. IMCC34160]|uniref:hypothetical protein n=1 Tax=Loktanella sp. IMCC34160 TaxID=2510646 RepID=UPI00101E1473|nr:hypothetical protein [Loktanella sp. IMCC34160]RYG90583.1 hypothetical protein EU803_11285 [Loktanella sp. IMCC34160]